MRIFFAISDLVSPSFINSASRSAAMKSHPKREEISEQADATELHTSLLIQSTILSGVNFEV